MPGPSLRAVHVEADTLAFLQSIANAELYKFTLTYRHLLWYTPPCWLESFPPSCPDLHRATATNPLVPYYLRTLFALLLARMSRKPCGINRLRTLAKTTDGTLLTNHNPLMTALYFHAVTNRFPNPFGIGFIQIAPGK